MRPSSSRPTPVSRSVSCLESTGRQRYRRWAAQSRQSRKVLPLLIWLGGPVASEYEITLTSYANPISVSRAQRESMVAKAHGVILSIVEIFGAVLRMTVPRDSDVKPEASVIRDVWTPTVGAT